MQIVMYVVLAFFCMIGILEFVRYLSIIIYTPRHKPNHFVVYPTKGNVEDLEMLIRSLHHQAQWDSYDGDTVVVLDLGLDDEGKRIAKILANDLDHVIYCTEEDMVEKIQEDMIE